MEAFNFTKEYWYHFIGHFFGVCYIDYQFLPFPWPTKTGREIGIYRRLRSKKIEKDAQFKLFIMSKNKGIKLISFKYTGSLSKLHCKIQDTLINFFKYRLLH